MKSLLYLSTIKIHKFSYQFIIRNIYLFKLKSSTVKIKIKMDFLIAMADCRIAVITIGLIGNLITFIVFSRPVFAKNSISTYCRALAIFDCFTIYELVADVGFVSFNYFVPQMSNIGCKLYYYAGISFASIPGWILIAFSIDKVLSMKNRAKFIKKKSFQYAVISGIVLFHLLLYIEVPLFLTRVFVANTTRVRCDVSTLPYGDIINMVSLVEGSFIPFVIMLGSTIISIKMIRDSAKNVQNLAQSNLPNRKSRDFKYAITSISFNIMFVVLKSPITFVVLLESYIPNITYVTIYVPFLFYFINYSSSFFIHLASNSIFRRELLVLLKLRSSNQVDSYNPNPSTVPSKIHTMQKLPSNYL